MPLTVARSLFCSFWWDQKAQFCPGGKKLISFPPFFSRAGFIQFLIVWSWKVRDGPSAAPRARVYLAPLPLSHATTRQKFLACPTPLFPPELGTRSKAGDCLTH